MKSIFHNKSFWLVGGVMALMLVYFWLATPAMNDDGFQYEGFAESLARGHLDFKSFYGFQGLSFFAVPVFWLTGSHNSIIIASIIFSLLSVPLAFLAGRVYFKNDRAGWYFLALFLLMPYPYTTMFRGFQEAALLFFILLIIYASFREKKWSPVAWSIGGIVKPFTLTLFPLFIENFLSRKKVVWVALALAIGMAYLGASYYQTGHLVNNAAINSYQGDFSTGSPPPLEKSFTFGLKGFLRIGANLLLSFRKVMISPVVILMGAWLLWRNKSLSKRKEIILVIVLNFLLVGLMTFSFSKYLLPMTTLFSLMAVPLLMKSFWAKALVLVDSFFVFKPIFSFFGHSYWPSFWVYLLPLFLASAIFAADCLYSDKVWKKYFIKPSH